MNPGDGSIFRKFGAMTVSLKRARDAAARRATGYYRVSTDGQVESGAAGLGCPALPSTGPRWPTRSTGLTAATWAY